MEIPCGANRLSAVASPSVESQLAVVPVKLGWPTTAVATPAAEASPSYCRISGLLDPEIAFEVSLPAKWNGRFYMIGNGGFAGDALDNPGRVTQRNEALKLGVAFAQTNTGHDDARSLVQLSS